MAVDARAAERRIPPGETERLGVVTDALPVGLAYLDQDRIFRFANRRFAAAYGLTPEEILGRPSETCAWPETKELGDPFFRAAELGQAVDFTHPLRHADGRMLTARTFLRPDIGADGAVQGFHICSINVTGQKAAEAAQLQAQRMEAVERLAGGLAQDLGGLLGAILDALRPLRAAGAEPGLPPGSDARRFADRLEPAIRAAEQGARLTGQLQAIARRLPLRPAPVDLARCLAEFVSVLRRTLPPRITVELETGGAARPALLDRAQFEAALLDLCLNARDAMPGGGRIRIALDHPPAGSGDFLRIVVEDDGPGMDPATAARAFDPFFTTKTDAGRGAGLGLAMVWGFVRQSGGAIAVDSAPGAGARFTLLLPAASSAAATAPAPLPGPEAAAPAPAGRGQVLVVDDNEALRRTIHRLLGRAGYGVVEAEGAEEALGLIRLLPDLRAMVSDVVMPGMSGFALAAEAARLRPTLGIVLMSGFEGVGALDRSAAAFPLLRKPFEPQELVQAIEAAAPPPPAQEPAA